MKAAVTREPGKIGIEEIDDPVPGPGEVLVQMGATGLCRSDLSVLDGHGFGPPLPAVLGHEGAGIIAAVGAGVRTVSVGDHVVCSIVLSCGTCFQCHTGNLSLCEVGTRAGFAGGMMDMTTRLFQNGEPISQFFCQSSFAEYAVLPETAAVRIRREVPLDIAAVLGCGAMTGIGAVYRRAEVRPMSTVVVIGAGGVGLSAIMAAKAAGALMVIAVDLSPRARELAMSVGASHVLDSADFASAVLQLTERGADYVIDTVGSPSTLETAVAATRAGGDIVLVGLADTSAKVSLTMFELCLQKRVTGTYAGSVIPHLDIPRAVDMYLAGRLPLDKLVTQRYSLEQLPAGIEQLRQGLSHGRSVVVFPVAS